MNKFYTVDQFAKLLNVSENTIRRAIKEGRIHACRPGIGKRSPYRIPDTEIERICVMDFQEIIRNLNSLK